MGRNVAEVFLTFEVLHFHFESARVMEDDKCTHKKEA